MNRLDQYEQDTIRNQIDDGQGYRTAQQVIGYFLQSWRNYATVLYFLQKLKNLALDQPA
jgi:hypothetical protein